jgi:hypothetical protein
MMDLDEAMGIFMRRAGDEITAFMAEHVGGNGWGTGEHPPASPAWDRTSTIAPCHGRGSRPTSALSASVSMDCLRRPDPSYCGCSRCRTSSGLA